MPRWILCSGIDKSKSRFYARGFSYLVSSKAAFTCTPELETTWLQLFPLRSTGRPHMTTPSKDPLRPTKNVPAMTDNHLDELDELLREFDEGILPLSTASVRSRLTEQLGLERLPEYPPPPTAVAAVLAETSVGETPSLAGTPATGSPAPVPTTHQDESPAAETADTDRLVEQDEGDTTAPLQQVLIAASVTPLAGRDDPTFIKSERAAARQEPVVKQEQRAGESYENPTVIDSDNENTPEPRSAGSNRSLLDQSLHDIATGSYEGQSTAVPIIFADAAADSHFPAFCNPQALPALQDAERITRLLRETGWTSDDALVRLVQVIMALALSCYGNGMHINSAQCRPSLKSLLDSFWSFTQTPTIPQTADFLVAIWGAMRDMLVSVNMDRATSEKRK